MRSIDPLTLAVWLRTGQAVLVDVREKMEFQNQRIEGAEHFPLSLLQDDPLDGLASVSAIIFYCWKGQRSEQAAVLVSADQPNRPVYYLRGGLKQWISDGFPVIDGKNQG